MSTGVKEKVYDAVVIVDRILSDPTASAEDVWDLSHKGVGLIFPY